MQFFSIKKMNNIIYYQLATKFEEKKIIKLDKSNQLLNKFVNFEISKFRNIKFQNIVCSKKIEN